MVFPQAIAVTAFAADGTSCLSLVGLSSKLVEQIPLPGRGTVDELQGESVAAVLGFVFSSAGPAAGREFSSVLMRVDLTGAHIVAPVPNVAGGPLEVHEMVYSLSDGKETRIPSLPIAGASTYAGDVVLLGRGTARVQQVAVFDSATGGTFQSYRVYENGTTARVLYETKEDAGSIEGFSISPNGQFVAVNVIPDYANSVSDGYPVDAQSTSISTVFIDIVSGTVVRSVAGFDESW